MNGGLELATCLYKRGFSIPYLSHVVIPGILSWIPKWVFGIDDCVLCPEEWKEFISVLKSCPQSVKTCFLKTIINSWATTHRMGERNVLSCIFGCANCEDNLKHYLSCDPLWSLAVSSCGLPSSFLSLSPLDRLCLRNKSTYGLRLLRVVYSVYHTVKLGHRELISYCTASNNFEVIYDLVIPISKEMWAHTWLRSECCILMWLVKKREESIY